MIVLIIYLIVNSLTLFRHKTLSPFQGESGVYVKSLSNASFNHVSLLVRVDTSTLTGQLVMQDNTAQIECLCLGSLPPSDLGALLRVDHFEVVIQRFNVFESVVDEVGSVVGWFYECIISVHMLSW